jgi:hypothetical protein
MLLIQPLRISPAGAREIECHRATRDRALHDCGCSPKLRLYLFTRKYLRNMSGVGMEELGFRGVDPSKKWGGEANRLTSGVNTSGQLI